MCVNLSWSKCYKRGAPHRPRCGEIRRKLPGPGKLLRESVNKPLPGISTKRREIFWSVDFCGLRSPRAVAHLYCAKHLESLREEGDSVSHTRAVWWRDRKKTVKYLLFRRGQDSGELEKNRFLPSQHRPRRSRDQIIRRRRGIHWRFV